MPLDHDEHKIGVLIQRLTCNVFYGLCQQFGKAFIRKFPIWTPLKLGEWSFLWVRIEPVLPLAQALKELLKRHFVRRLAKELFVEVLGPKIILLTNA